MYKSSIEIFYEFTPVKMYYNELVEVGQFESCFAELFKVDNDRIR